jgi:serralysin
MHTPTARHDPDQLGHILSLSGLGDDTLLGNAANNVLRGNRGNDTIDGGSGIDTAIYVGTRGGYTLSATSIADKSGYEGTDTLTGIERLQFSDSKVALDLSGAGHAGLVARLLDVTFGKSSVSNAAFVGAGLGALDGGMAFGTLATAVMNALGKTTPSDALTLIWTNLAGTAPAANQVTELLGALGNPDVATLTTLVANHELTAQHVGLVGLAETGLAYS